MSPSKSALLTSIACLSVCLFISATFSVAFLSIVGLYRLYCLYCLSNQRARSRFRLRLHSCTASFELLLCGHWSNPAACQPSLEIGACRPTTPLGVFPLSAREPSDQRSSHSPLLVVSATDLIQVERSPPFSLRIWGPPSAFIPSSTDTDVFPTPQS